MDWTSIIVAVLACIGTAIGSIYGISRSNNLIVYRMDKLEKKVDEHNNVIKRTYKLEEKAAIQEEQIKVVNHRIEDLEGSK
jgi:hypothetical protein